MRKNLILILFAVCMLNLNSFSQINKLIAGSKNNQFSIKINNTLSTDINGIRVFPAMIPEAIKLNTSEVNIERIAANSSFYAKFSFEINMNTDISKSDSIDFIVSSKEGKSWHKIIVFTVDSPIEYHLAQNYPNPFNPTTTINYSIPRRIKVILKVFNILGQNVKTLVDETKKPGVYEVTFNANDLASGVYFYSLSTPEFSRTYKMVLAK